MTNTTATDGKGVTRASQFARTANTLRLHHLVEEQHRLEIAGRITQLREKSRWTQPDIAEKLGLTLRGYQKIEEKGTSKFERAEEIAAIHGVDPNWIWDGEEKAGAPDVLSALSPTTDLSAIHRKLDLILDHLGITVTSEEGAPEIDPDFSDDPLVRDEQERSGSGRPSSEAI